jgi:hypothetical protein
MDDAWSESNLCVPRALPVSEQLRTQSTGKASGTHGSRDAGMPTVPLDLPDL